MDHIMAKLDRIEAQLNRMWLHIDFIRTHYATYLGDGVALTYLNDETKMLVNANDSGGPMGLISGGLYEEDNLNIFLSFLRDDSVFVDIGANLGFFSLKIGERLRRHGRVLAFEPHPKLAALLQRSVDLNGLAGVVTVHNFGLSDRNMPITFSYPKAHLGGGRVGRADDTARFDIVASEVRQLDDVLDPNMAVDLVKIDVEGHELAALRGMRRVLDRSPRAMVLFEKLGRNAGGEAEVEEFFAERGMALYAVNAKATLAPIAAGALAAFSGYVFAARDAQVDDLKRSRFTIYPSQLNVNSGAIPRPNEPLVREGEPGRNLFYGPYWYLPRGVWELRLNGTVSGEIDIVVAERFGYHTERLRFSDTQRSVRFINNRDLVKFELIAQPIGFLARIEVERLDLVRLG